MDVTLPKWWEDGFPPLSLFSGGNDFLICADSLMERLREKETDVKIVRAEKIELSEVSISLFLVITTLTNLSSTVIFIGQRKLWSGASL